MMNHAGSETNKFAGKLAKIGHCFVIGLIRHQRSLSLLTAIVGAVLIALSAWHFEGYREVSTALALLTAGLLSAMASITIGLQSIAVRLQTALIRYPLMPLIAAFFWLSY
jgi:hypothetical protein